MQYYLLGKKTKITATSLFTTNEIKSFLEETPLYTLFDDYTIARKAAKHPSPDEQRIIFRVEFEGEAEQGVYTLAYGNQVDIIKAPWQQVKILAASFVHIHYELGIVPLPEIKTSALSEYEESIEYAHVDTTVENGQNLLHPLVNQTQSIIQKIKGSLTFFMSTLALKALQFQINYAEKANKTFLSCLCLDDQHFSSPEQEKNYIRLEEIKECLHLSPIVEVFVEEPFRRILRTARVENRKNDEITLPGFTRRNSFLENLGNKQLTNDTREFTQIPYKNRKFTNG